MSEFLNKSYYNEELIRKIKFLREKTIKSKRKYTLEDLNRPVSYWIKDERLLNDVGKEFTIILKTRGCNWALGENGGCSMCGYIQDANIDCVKPELIINQINYAFSNKLEEIEAMDNKYVLKLFNSGSFFDEREVPLEVKKQIYEKVEGIKNIKELVVESRVEYITRKNLAELKDSLKSKYIEIGIGLETVDDYIRNNYINKGLTYEEFIESLNLCKEFGIGVKAYLLFKPPFLNEQAAIDDCCNSIKTLTRLKVNTISINPLNIQKGSLAEYLWFQNRYRPPWFYSLFKCIKKALTQQDLQSIRILSDPSGAGTKRGIHNCLRMECNLEMLNRLKEFVFTQDLQKLIKRDFECECKIKYEMEHNYS